MIDMRSSSTASSNCEDDPLLVEETVLEKTVLETTQHKQEEDQGRLAVSSYNYGPPNGTCASSSTCASEKSYNYKFNEPVVVTSLNNYGTSASSSSYGTSYSSTTSAAYGTSVNSAAYGTPVNSAYYGTPVNGIPVNSAYHGTSAADESSTSYGTLHPAQSERESFAKMSGSAYSMENMADQYDHGDHVFV